MTKIDFNRLKQQTDLLTLAGQATPLKKVAGTNGGEWAGPCPFCGGRDRFRVQPHGPQGGRWLCRGCTAAKWQDCIEYVKRRDGVHAGEAARRLSFVEGSAGLDLPTLASCAGEPGSRGAGVKKGSPCHLVTLSPCHLVTPPSDLWQAKARAFVGWAQEQLWRPAGSAGLDYLHRRGFSNETILAAGLGYNPRDFYRERAAWGLASSLGAPRLWLPPGVVIPWESEGVLWRVNIRLLEPRYDRAGRLIKYIGPAGWGGGNPLYDAGRLTPDRPAILVEAELDALTARQTAGDLITAVATGSASGGRHYKWLMRLALPPLVLVSFDADKAGDEAARFWTNALPNARRWRPFWNDVNQMAQDGVDLRAWLLARLAP